MTIADADTALDTVIAILNAEIYSAALDDVLAALAAASVAAYKVDGTDVEMLTRIHNDIKKEKDNHGA